MTITTPPDSVRSAVRTPIARPPIARPPAPGRRSRRAARTLVPAIVTALTLGLAGCGGSSGHSTPVAARAADGGAPAAAPGGAAQYEARAKGADASGSSRDAAGAASPAATGSAGTGSAGTVKARLIRTAQVSIEISGQLAVAAAQVRNVAKQFGGHVESETTGIGDAAEQKASGGSDAAPKVAQRGESLVVLRIPEPKLDDAIGAVTDRPGLPGGKVLSQTSSSQDVTGDIADLTSRVASQRASLDRVRALMARATSLQDVVTLESELSRRQSDLEALESRLATVSDQADLSTLTVLLRTPGAPAQESESDTGFLAGLKSGWHAVEVSTTVVLTVLGGLLPIAVMAVAIGWPVLLLRRRRGRRATTPPAPDAPDAPDGSDGSDQPQPVGAGSPSGA